MNRNFLWHLYDVIFDWFDSVLHTFGAAFVAWFLVGSAIWALQRIKDGLPIWPLTHYTALWIVALLFPITSSVYLIFDLRLRRNQIQDAAERAELQFVYFPGSPQAARQFRRMLRQRFRESCQPWELTSFALIAGMVTLVGGYLVYWNAFNVPSDNGPTTVISLERLNIFAAFSGALAGACIYLFRKFRSFDVYPSTYLQATIGFISGTLGATFLSGFYTPAVVQITFLAFGIGFLTSTNVGFLGNLLRKRMAQLTDTNLPPDIQGDLETIIQNTDAIESLHNISLYSIAELVKAEPLIIYLNLPQSLGVINGWIDEALLLYYFGSDNVLLMAKVGIRRFTQVIEQAVDRWPGTGCTVDDIEWKKTLPLLAGSQIEQLVLLEVACIIRAKVHNRLLAILNDRYRDTFFSPQSDAVPRGSLSEAA